MRLPPKVPPKQMPVPKEPLQHGAADRRDYSVKSQIPPDRKGSNIPDRMNNYFDRKMNTVTHMERGVDDSALSSGVSKRMNQLDVDAKHKDIQVTYRDSPKKEWRAEKQAAKAELKKWEGENKEDLSFIKARDKADAKGLGRPYRPIDTVLEGSTPASIQRAAQDAHFDSVKEQHTQKKEHVDEIRRNAPFHGKYRNQLDKVKDAFVDSEAGDMRRAYREAKSELRQQSANANIARDNYAFAHKHELKLSEATNRRATSAPTRREAIADTNHMRELKNAAKFSEDHMTPSEKKLIRSEHKDSKHIEKLASAADKERAKLERMGGHAKSEAPIMQSQAVVPPSTPSISPMEVQSGSPRVRSTEPTNTTPPSSRRTSTDSRPDSMPGPQREVYDSGAGVAFPGMPGFLGGRPAAPVPPPPSEIHLARREILNSESPRVFDYQGPSSIPPRE